MNLSDKTISIWNKAKDCNCGSEPQDSAADHKLCGLCNGIMHFGAHVSVENQKNSSGTWKDWPKELLLECYKKESGKTYTSVYGRLKKDFVSPTLTTQFTRYGTGRYGHYDQNRALSLREGAILQTFPEKYEFNSELGSTIISRQIGNAVPPIFAEVLGNEILNKLKK